MAKKFTQLPAVQSLTLNDILAVVNGGESRKATLDQVRELLTSNVAQNISMYASATSGATVVGTVYVPQSKTLSTDSLAYIGGISQNDSTALSLVPAGGGNSVATWTRVGLLGNQALASPASISLAGWYDIVLTPGASGTAFARGLYLV